MTNIRTSHEGQLSAVGNAEILSVRLHSIRYAAPDINVYEFRPLDGGNLPLFTAGAHIDLHLAPGMVRSYSLMNSQDERHRYAVAVKKEANGRGGSKAVHDDLRVGQELSISTPLNNFPLNESASRSVLVAGGIGITPIYCMAQCLNALGCDWELHYAARSRKYAAFLSDLEAFGSRVRFHFDDEAGESVMDMAAMVGGQPEATHFYCCGPLPMMAAFEEALAERPDEYVHLEYFKAAAPVIAEGGYEVVLQRSGQTVTIEPGQTILDAVLALGIDAPFSCMEGICGSCEVKVIEGIPDHHDFVLSKEEQAKNEKTMICCSGSRTPRLVLDL